MQFIGLGSEAAIGAAVDMFCPVWHSIPCPEVNKLIGHNALVLCSCFINSLVWKGMPLSLLLWGWGGTTCYGVIILLFRLERSFTQAM
jgi:hypothetical protein